MAKSSGGTRGASGGARAKASGFQGDATMRGYSQGLAKSIYSEESNIRNKPIEYGLIIDESGNVISRNVGTKSGVYIKGNMENNIITHNHPSGRSLSDKDLFQAALHNAKEIRAVGSNGYTYTLKRPEKGWGVDSTNHGKILTKSGSWKDNASVTRMKGRYKRILNKMREEHLKYTSTYKGDREVALRRSSLVFHHKVNKLFAKSMGWDYQRVKVN